MASFILIFMLGGLPWTAYAKDCTKDTLINRFGDWFATVGKKEKKKNLILTARKTNRRLVCTEKQAQEAAKAVQKSGDNTRSLA